MPFGKKMNIIKTEQAN